MSELRSLGFRLLDAHVIAGQADTLAFVSEGLTLSYAELLHETASLAAGLRDLGAGVGTPIRLHTPERRVRVLGGLAILRLGAEPVRSNDPWYLRIGGTPPVIETESDGTPVEALEFDLVRRAGRVDPAASLARDPEGYEQRVSHLWGDLIEPLLHGGTLT